MEETSIEKSTRDPKLLVEVLKEAQCLRGDTLIILFPNIDVTWFSKKLKTGGYGIEKIGGGSFSVVYKVFSETLDKYVAVKEFILHKNPKKAAEDSRTDFEIMMDINSGDIQYPTEFRKGIFNSNGFLKILSIERYERENGIIIFEYCKFGNLENNPIRYRLKIAETSRNILELLTTLGDVHAAGYSHGDIKPNNILIRADYSFVLADYGSLSVKDKYNPKFGAILYKAPEIFLVYETIDPYKGDVWALGLVFYEWLMNYNPISELLNKNKNIWQKKDTTGPNFETNLKIVLGQLMNNLSVESWEFEKHIFNNMKKSNLHDSFVVLICEMLRFEPSRRPTIADLLSRFKYDAKTGLIIVGEKKKEKKEAYKKMRKGKENRKENNIEKDEKKGEENKEENEKDKQKDENKKEVDMSESNQIENDEPEKKFTDKKNNQNEKIEQLEKEIVKEKPSESHESQSNVIETSGANNQELTGHKIYERLYETLSAELFEKKEEEKGEEKKKDKYIDEKINQIKKKEDKDKEGGVKYQNAPEIKENVHDRDNQKLATNPIDYGKASETFEDELGSQNKII
jgi:serine/threonine protein kinase